ncbi:MAG TPA: hypothetical protein VMW72_01620, partial [Sedimentisphaerales bacterium]|nr:hypothetical protein [Sedimentisphaerales bacterium]
LRRWRLALTSLADQMVMTEHAVDNPEEDEEKEMYHSCNSLDLTSVIREITKNNESPQKNTYITRIYKRKNIDKNQKICNILVQSTSNLTSRIYNGLSV